MDTATESSPVVETAPATEPKKLALVKPASKPKAKSTSKAAKPAPAAPAKGSKSSKAAKPAPAAAKGKAKTEKREVKGVFKDGTPKMADIGDIEGKKVKILVDENPKRGLSAKRFSIYKNGMLATVAIEKGVLRADLRWDVGHKFISLS